MFVSYKNSLKIDESKIEVPSLKLLVGKMGDKDAIDLSLYLFLIHERGEENPMRDLSERERVKEVGLMIYGDASIDICAKYPTHSKLISDAINEFKSKVDKVQKELDLYDNKLFQFIDLLEDPDNEPKIIKNEHEISGKISYSTNISILTKVLENVIKIIVDKSAIQAMKKGGRYLKPLRGGLSPNSKGKVTTMKD